MMRKILFFILIFIGVSALPSFAGTVRYFEDVELEGNLSIEENLTVKGNLYVLDAKSFFFDLDNTQSGNLYVDEPFEFPVILEEWRVVVYEDIAHDLTLSGSKDDAEFSVTAATRPWVAAGNRVGPWVAVNELFTDQERFQFYADFAHGDDLTVIGVLQCRIRTKPD